MALVSLMSPQALGNGFDLATWQDQEVTLARYKANSVLVDVITKKDLRLATDPQNPSASSYILKKGSVLETEIDKQTFMDNIRGLPNVNPEAPNGSLIIDNKDISKALGPDRRNFRVIIKGPNTEKLRMGDVITATPDDLQGYIQTKVNAEYPTPTAAPEDTDNSPENDLPSPLDRPPRTETEASGPGDCLSCLNNGNQTQTQAQSLAGLTPLKAVAASYSNDPHTKKMLKALLRSASRKSGGYCYRKVKQGMLFGGVTDHYYAGISPAATAAKQLKKDGFTNLLDNPQYKKDLMKNPKLAPNGAIMVYSGGKYGHIEVRVDDGNKNGFVSDYFNRRARTGDTGNGRGRKLVGVYIKDNAQMAKR